MKRGGVGRGRVMRRGDGETDGETKKCRKKLSKTI